VKLEDDQWNIGHLQSHLQAAAELEAWTIPYYMAAMLSIVDRSSDAYQPASATWPAAESLALAAAAAYASAPPGVRGSRRSARRRSRAG
jgi:hypothetical protein